MLPTMPHTLRSRRHEALVAALVAARVAREYTQRELAVRLKVTQTYIASIEAGQRRVDVIEFLDMCRVLEIDPISVLNKLCQ